MITVYVYYINGEMDEFVCDNFSCDKEAMVFILSFGRRASRETYIPFSATKRVEVVR